jgi:hypothetical protein
MPAPAGEPIGQQHLESCAHSYAPVSTCSVSTTLSVWRVVRHFSRRTSDLLAVASAIRYPVFINGDNYRGDRDSLVRHPVLRPFIDKVLAPDVRRVPNAFVVLLGSAVSGALEYLINNDGLDPDRVLLDFPHPSGRNRDGDDRWRSNQKQLQRRVDRWFGI